LVKDYTNRLLFSSEKLSSDNVLLVVNEDLQIGNISELEIVDKNNYIEYGEIYFTMHNENLEDVLNDIIGYYSPFEDERYSNNTNKEVKNNYFYLLTK
jgi:hypothetical protein